MNLYQTFDRVYKWRKAVIRRGYPIPPGYNPGWSYSDEYRAEYLQDYIKRYVLTWRKTYPLSKGH